MYDTFDNTYQVCRIYQHFLKYVPYDLALVTHVSGDDRNRLFVQDDVYGGQNRSSSTLGHSGPSMFTQMHFISKSAM